MPVVSIAHRFRGPPQSANGGYACGLVAAAIAPDPAVEVTLLAPPPLESELTLEPAADGAELRDGEQPVAKGRPAPAPELELPEPVSLDAAREARRTSPTRQDHPFPMCFVCGTERPDDGLQVILGPAHGGEVVAAPFESRAEHADGAGRVRDEIVWSVLDCPSGVAGVLEPGLGMCVLGRLTGLLEQPLEAGRDYVAVGWRIERDGRKFHAGSAIFSEDGEPLARARATWIELREQPA